MADAITVNALSKRYRIGMRAHRHATLGGTLLGGLASPLANLRRLRRMTAFDESRAEPDILWALRDVSFRVERGEILGLIGANGAGKSTLLKLLSRVTEPTRGTARIRGRVASLLEVGTGFHPDLTGRENVYLSGLLLGMCRQEIDGHFDAIVSFAGVAHVIDTPLKRYSAGLAVRLGFAVGAHLEADILLVDEVLAVGDAAFRRQCLGKMRDVADGGRTVILVSHSLAAITGLCRRSLWLDAGQLVADGPASAVVARYLAHGRGPGAATDLALRKDREGSGDVRVTAVRFGYPEAPAAGCWTTGRNALLEIQYAVTPGRNVARIEVSASVRTREDSPLLQLASRLTGQVLDGVSPSGCFRCNIPRLGLEAGSYRVQLELRCGGVLADRVPAAAEVDVLEGDFFGSGVAPTQGGVAVEHQWSRA